MEVDLEKDASLEKAETVVKELYSFCAHFFQNRGVEHAAKKWDEVKVQMETAVDLLDSLQDSLPKEQYWSLKGRALNILPEHSPEAEDYLARATKHDPSKVDTWNALGESYWKAGKVQLAHDCFAGSLAHSKNKESLRNLSMVLRQMGKDSAEKEAKAKESLDKAKEAVAMDVKDGTSWMILGNAYLALFFMTGQDSKMLKQCYAAYSHAEKDPVVAMNPDLHFNRATLCHYEEEYQRMLEELDQASLLDPGWTAPRDKLGSSWDFLTAMANLISCKGKVKTKTLSTIMEALSAPESYIAGSGLNGDGGGGGGGGGEGKEDVASDGSKRVLTKLADLKEGPNSGAVVVVGVAAVVPSQETIPHGCVVLDVEECCVGLTVYNLANAVQFPPGKILTIPDPHLSHCSVKYREQEVQFKNLRVADPSKLLVNGEALKTDKLAPSAVTVTAFS